MNFPLCRRKRKGEQGAEGVGRQISSETSDLEEKVIQFVPGVVTL